MNRVTPSIIRLPRSLAANIDITVVRITNKAVAPALQLPVEFVEHGAAPPQNSSCIKIYLVIYL